jgi:hypothetical protein
MRSTKEVVGRVSSSSKSPRIFSIKYSLISTHRKFSEFLFQINSESEEISMEKVVHLSEIFETIFCFNFSELGKYFSN